MLTIRKRFARPLRNVVANWLGSSTSMLIAFFLSPFVVHHLGATAYGVWILLTSLTGYLGLLDLGVRGAVTTSIAKLHTQGRHKDASHLVSSALALFLLLGGVVLLISVIAGLTASRIFHSVPAHIRLLSVLCGASLATSMIAGVFGAIVVGLQRFELNNAIESALAILKALSILFALGNGNGLVALATIQLVFSALTVVAYLCASRVLYPQLIVRVVPDRINTSYIVSFGSQLFLLNVSAYLIFYTDSIVVAAFLPVAMVTLFAIAGNLVNYSRMLISGVSTTLTPLASSIEAQGGAESLEKLGVAGSRYATILVLPIVITFLLRGETFIGLWMGAEYAAPSGKILQVLSLALFFSAATQATTSIMIGINKHRPLVFANIVEGVVNLLLSIILIRSMGIVGVAWGTTIPRLVISCIFWPLYLRRTLGISLATYGLAVWGGPVLAALPFAVLSLVIQTMWRATSVLMFLYQVVLSIPVYAIVLWFTCLSKSERYACSGRPYMPICGVREAA